jgi:hypothetical protein
MLMVAISWWIFTRQDTFIQSYTTRFILFQFFVLHVCYMFRFVLREVRKYKNNTKEDIK